MAIDRAMAGSLTYTDRENPCRKRRGCYEAELAYADGDIRATGYLHRATKSPPRFGGGQSEKENQGRVYLAGLAGLAVVRLNFEVNFSTRPAVSTRRFSPV